LLNDLAMDVPYPPIARAEKLIESIPVNNIGQLDQPMAGIDHAAKLDPEQILLPIGVRRFLWFHALKNCKVLDGCCRKICNFDSTLYQQLPIKSDGITAFQRRLTYPKRAHEKGGKKSRPIVWFRFDLSSIIQFEVHI
jgi:hypothetical protein